MIDYIVWYLSYIHNKQYLFLLSIIDNVYICYSGMIHTFYVWCPCCTTFISGSMSTIFYVRYPCMIDNIYLCLVSTIHNFYTLNPWYIICLLECPRCTILMSVIQDKQYYYVWYRWYKIVYLQYPWYTLFSSAWYPWYTFLAGILFWFCVLRISHHQKYLYLISEEVML